MGNIGFNPISALARATIAEICRHLGARELVIRMMRETLEVAARLGAHPEIAIERRLGADAPGHQRAGRPPQ
jgi:2-dehydropantoate 2-reductase